MDYLYKKNNRKPSGAQNTPSSKTPEIKIEKKIVVDERGRRRVYDILHNGYGAPFSEYTLTSTPLPSLNTSGAGANQSQHNTNHTTGANQSRDNANHTTGANQSRNTNPKPAPTRLPHHNTPGAGANHSRNNTNRGAGANHSWHNANHTTGANHSQNNTNPEPASTQPQPLPVLAADANHSRDNTNPASASTQGPHLNTSGAGANHSRNNTNRGAGANQSQNNTNSEPVSTQLPPLPEFAPVPTQAPDTDVPMDEQEAINNLRTNTINTSNIIKLERFFNDINGWNKNSNIKNIRTLEDLLKLMYMHKISDFTDEKDMCAFIDMHKQSDIRKIGDISEIIKKKLTVNEIKSFSEYVGGTYEAINNYLRFDNTDEGAIKNDVDNMKSAFTKAPRLMGDITVYRGCTKCVIDNELIDFTTDIDKEKIGKWIGKNAIISDKGFMSTSVKKEVAIGHCKKSGALLRIKVPKGTPAFYVTKELENRTFSGDLRHESEIIFGVNQKIKISKIEEPEIKVNEINEIEKSEGKRLYYIIDGELQMQDGGAAQQKRRTSASG